MSGVLPPLRDSPVPMSARSYAGASKAGADFAFFLSWFLLIALVAWVIIFTTQPSYVKCDGELNYPKMLLWAVVFALIVVVILWMLRNVGRYF